MEKKRVLNPVRNLFGLSVYARVPSWLSIVLPILVLVVVLGLYFAVSSARHADNPSDKLMPTFGQLASGIERAVTPNNNGEIILLVDTIASFKRFFAGVIIGSVLGIFLGLHMGLFPLLEAWLYRVVLLWSKIPPLVLLPLVFIFAGVGEVAKVFLITIGILPPTILAVYFRTKSIPRQQFVKALTLGGSTAEVVQVAFAQVMPYTLNSIRIGMLNAWMFLIVSETIQAHAGLGYRMFLVMRYLAMDTIIPYVIWIALLAFALDALLAWWVHHKYPWYEG